MTHEKQPAPLGYRTPCWKAAGRVLDKRAREMAAHEQGTRLGADIEALHDMRVASRRLREALSLFGEFFPEDRIRPIRKRVRRITRALGPVRNLDVMIEFFTALAAEKDLDPRESDAITWLIERAREDREKDRVRMIDGLDKADVQNLVRDISELTTMPPNRPKRGSAPAALPNEPLYVHGQHLTAERATAMVAAWRVAALNHNDEESLHALRITFKHLRYTVEIFRPVFDNSYPALAKQFKAFQTVIGDIHDLDVFAAEAARRLKRIAKTSPLCPLAQGLRRVERRLRKRRAQLERQFRSMGRATPPRRLVVAMHAAFRHPAR